MHPSLYPWRRVCDVQPNDDSTTALAQGDKIFRIADLDGSLRAPSWPTMGHAGQLIVRSAITVPKAHHVGSAPFSATPRPQR